MSRITAPLKPGPPDVPARPGVSIRYMGNKRALAGEVADACRGFSASLPLVDLFGGMCNVAGALAPSGRQVHVNDAQRYAELAARCLLTTSTPPPDPGYVAAQLRPAFVRNRDCLAERFGAFLQREAEVLRSADPKRMRAAGAAWPHTAIDADIAAEAAALRANPGFPYRLCTLNFAWGYFGLAQSIELDSLRFAIDAAARDRSLPPAQADWLRLALLQTASRIASTPGHFAQFLRPRTDSGAARIAAFRSRSAWDWFLRDVARIRPFGTAAWRSKNRVSCGDALQLVENVARRAQPKPSIYYADPPYSKEHYSRFYHVLETLERYDYPQAAGAGRYRPDRFRSDFAVATRVLTATRRLLASIAEAGGVLLFSYPSTGLLLRHTDVSLRALLSTYFDDVRLVVDRAAVHSTLGGRHGAPSRAVREQVWLGH